MHLGDSFWISLEFKLVPKNSGKTWITFRRSILNIFNLVRNFMHILEVPHEIPQTYAKIISILYGICIKIKKNILNKELSFSLFNIHKVHFWDKYFCHLSMAIFFHFLCSVKHLLLKFLRQQLLSLKLHPVVVPG